MAMVPEEADLPDILTPRESGIDARQVEEKREANAGDELRASRIQVKLAAILSVVLFAWSSYSSQEEFIDERESR